MIGEVPVATALLFDLGVFALVVGATVVVLIALAHQSLRAAARGRRRRRPSRTCRARPPAAEEG